MPLLTDAQRQEFAVAHPDWAIHGESIIRTFEFANFQAAMGFVTSVALAAERAFHHPDIDIRWNKVTLALSTHDQGGLTEKDTDLAAKIDRFA
jgi:4a-hydroxytetrahydrobiopterin dehydratase